MSRPRGRPKGTGHDKQILAFLRERAGEPTTLTQIALAVGITRPGAYAALKRLQAQGKVEVLEYGRGRGYGNRYRVIEVEGNDE